MGQRVLQTSCSLCENAGLLCCCPTCVNTSIGEKYKNSATVFKQRQRLRDKIETTLNFKNTLEHQQRQQQRFEQYARLQALSQRVAEKQERVGKMRQAIEEKRAENRDKARQLEKANSELAAKRQELLYNYYPDIIRIHSLQYSMLEKQLAGQQRDKLRRLRSMLPLRLHFGEQRHQSQAPQPRQVSICNIRLPLAEDFKGALRFPPPIWPFPLKDSKGNPTIPPAILPNPAKDVVEHGVPCPPHLPNPCEGL